MADGDNFDVGGDYIRGDQHIHGDKIDGDKIIHHHHYGGAAASTSKPIRVMISYNWNAADKAVVEKLHSALEADPLIEPWRDRDNLPHRGKTLRSELKSALDQADIVLPVLSPEAAKRGADRSSNLGLEWAYLREQCTPVLPLLVRTEAGQSPEALMPPDFYAVPWLDFRDETAFDATVAKLIKQVKGASAQIGQRLGSGWRQLPPGVLTRPSLIEQVKQALQMDEALSMMAGESNIVSMYAPGGLGKSLLATLIAHDCDVRRHFTNGVVWVGVGPHGTVERVCADIALALGAPPDQHNTPATLTHLLADKTSLIILDDAWQRDVIKACCVPTSRTRYLVTTRQKNLLPLPNENKVRLDYLTPDEGADLIAKRLWAVTADTPTDDGTHPERDVHKRIAEQLAGHTLAIDICAARLANADPGDPSDLLAELQGADSALLEALKRDIDADSSEDSFLKSFSLSYEALPPERQRRMRLLGVFSTEGTFDAEAVEQVWGEKSVGRLLNDLRNRALVEEKAEGRYTLHMLSAAAARTLMAPDERDTAQRQHAEYYAQLGSEFGEDFNTAQRMVIEEAQIDAAYEWARDAKDADLCYRVGWGYAWAAELQGKLHPNQEKLTTALELIGDADDSESLKRKAYLHSALADMARVFDQPSDVEQHLKQKLAFAQAIDHVELEGHAWAKLASLALSLGDFDKAERLNQRAMERYEKIDYVLGIGDSLGLGADIAEARGELTAARMLNSRAIELYEHNDDHHAAAGRLSSVARLAEQLNQPEQAVEHYRHALATFEKVGDWASVANTRWDLGITLYNLGQTKEACTLLQQAQQDAVSLGLTIASFMTEHLDELGC